MGRKVNARVPLHVRIFLSVSVCGHGHVCVPLCAGLTQEGPKGLTNSGGGGEFPGDPVVKHLPCNAGNAGWIPSCGTKIPCAAEQLKPVCCRYWAPGPQRGSPCSTKKDAT